MNDGIAERTIEDHKYLLEHVENRCAIAYFAAANRNLSLYNALQHYFNEQQDALDDQSERKSPEEEFGSTAYLEKTFQKIILEYDFMSIVMYPDLKHRREFVHDCWTIAKACENEELKLGISRDPYFYLEREDLLVLLRTRDNMMITHILKSQCNLVLVDDISYKLVQIKHA